MNTKRVLSLLALPILVMTFFPSFGHNVTAQDGDGPFEFEENNNCVVPLSDLEGTFYVMSGASGSGGPGQDYIQPNYDALFDYYGDFPTRGNEEVVIIIVDFFDPNGDGLVNIAGYGQIPHGDLVVDHLNSLLESIDTNISTETVEVSRGYNTLEIYNEIKEIMMDSDESITNFVINMSIGIIPCDLIDTLDEYRGNGEIVEFANQLLSQIILDPLKDPLIDALGDFREEFVDVTYIAAACNIGLDFPCYPALDDSVVGVGAFDFNMNRASYSNLPGFNGCWEMGAYWSNIVGVPVHGTSFAAPTHSFRKALEMSNGLSGGMCYSFGEPLIILDNGNYLPNIIESWEVNDDGTILTFYVSDSFFTSDGQPISAPLIIAHLANVASNQSGDFFVWIVNAIAAENYEIVDDYTFVITLANPDDFISMFNLLSQTTFKLD